MRFALLGNHPDGVELTLALVSAGHTLLAFTSPGGSEAGFPTSARRVSDSEEVLADPGVELVVVAGPPSTRPAQLRRALQSEHHVVCVHPCDDTPAAAYEAGLIQKDTGFHLLPLLVESQHPAFRRLAEFVDRSALEPQPRSPLGPFRLLEVERSGAGEVLLNAGHEGMKAGFPGWEVLRSLAGEVAEVSALAEGEEAGPGEPVLLAGRFLQGGLFRVSLVPNQPGAGWRYLVVGNTGRAELTFPQGWNGPACLNWRTPEGEEREEYWEPWDPWPGLARVVEGALSLPRQPPVVGHVEGIQTRPAVPRLELTQGPTWQDEVRCLELDESARRSISKRRADVLDYQDVSEEVGFKGTMTLLGCGLLWVVVLLLVLSRWVPWAGWLILPLLVGFMAMQMLRYAIPREPPAGK